MSDPFIRVLSSGDRTYVHVTMQPLAPFVLDEDEREYIRHSASEIVASAIYREERCCEEWIDLGGEA